MNDNKKNDQILVLGALSDTTAVGVRFEGDSVSVGTISTDPNACGELIKLSAVDNNQGLYDVSPRGPSEIKGPAKVNSNSYRAGHDRIFGSKQSVGSC